MFTFQLNIKFKPVSTPNFWPGRKGNKIEHIVLHITDGKLEGALRTIQNPQKQVSYHYIVAKNGDIWKIVDDENTAWHAGLIYNPTSKILKPNVNPNLYTLGVGCEGLRGEIINPIQEKSLKKLLTFLFIRHNLPVQLETLLYHREIRSNKTCPDIYINKEKIFADLVIILGVFKFLTE